MISPALSPASPAQQHGQIGARVHPLGHLHQSLKRVEVVEPRLRQRRVARNVFVIPTLTIRKRAKPGAEWQANGDTLLRNQAITEYLADTIGKELSVPLVGNDHWRVIAAQNAARLHHGGVTILAGSDAPNPGIRGARVSITNCSCWSMQDSLKKRHLRQRPHVLLLGSALTTGAASLHECGPMYLLECDPVEAIECTTRIAAVWHRGARIRRKAVNPVESGNQ